MRILAILAAAICVGCAHHEANTATAKPRVVAAKPAVARHDDKAAIVAASIYTYKGPCPCPYSKDGACKGQSAWDSPRGVEPRCYKSDVTAEDIKKWHDLMKAAPERPSQ